MADGKLSYAWVARAAVKFCRYPGFGKGVDYGVFASAAAEYHNFHSFHSFSR